MNASSVETGVYADTTEILPVETRFTRWTSWLVWMALKVGFSFSVLFVTCVIAYRWIAHGITTAGRAITNHAAELYGLLDAISPSVDQEEREEKRDRVVEVFENILDNMTFAEHLWVDWQTVWLYLSLVAGGIVTCLGAYMTVKASYRSGRRMIQRVRGIQFESIREGSDFRVATIPTSQVAILEPGMLIDTHIGYGLRYNDFLIAPRHVFMKKGELVHEALLQGPKAKIVALIRVTPSKAVDDLVYVFLDQKTWSMLGVTKGKWAGKAVATHATCTGANGASTGRVAKTAVRWMISYGGSTVPGMSGAGYYSNGEIQGVHQGSSGPYNLGIAAALIVAEARLIVKPEDSGDVNPDAAKPRFLTAQKLWKEIDAFDDLATKYAIDDWSQAREVDYNQRLSFDDDLDEESARPRNRRSALPVRLPAGGIRLEAQGNDSETLESVIVTRSDAQYLRTLMDNHVVERLTELEKRVGLMEQRMGPKEKSPCPVCSLLISKGKLQAHIENSHPVRHVCDVCGVAAKSAEKLAKHAANSHPTKLESAVPSDTGARGKTVKQGSFLGKRSSSVKSNSKSSTRSSSPSTSSRPSRPEGESLSHMLDSQRSIESSLKELLAVMRGQSSVVRQS